MNAGEVKLSVPFPVALSIAALMEFSYRFFGIKNRPLLTRQAVVSLAYKTTYSNKKLSATSI